MIRRHFGQLAIALALPLAFSAATAHAQAQAYPAKPIRMVVPFPPGGGTDILARLVAQKLTEANHWTVVPDNRGGAGGTIGIAEAARAAPTGYDIVMGQKDNMVVAPWLYKNLSYNPVKDLTAVAHVAYTPVVIVTQVNSKFKTLDDVVKAARAAPDTVTYGSPGNGTTIHLAGEIFNGAAKIKMRHVPYKGSNAAMMDVLAGNVDLMVSSVPSAMAQIKAGKLRPLAVTSAKRSTSLPDTPTVAELGYKDFDVSTWAGRHAEGDRHHAQRRGQQAAGHAGDEGRDHCAGRRAAEHDAGTVRCAAEDGLREVEGDRAGLGGDDRVRDAGGGSAPEPGSTAEEPPGRTKSFFRARPNFPNRAAPVSGTLRQRGSRWRSSRTG
jgi:tripartite-type tricarboxylate transporter receptor subunit TctC